MFIKKGGFVMNIKKLMVLGVLSAFLSGGFTCANNKVRELEAKIADFRKEGI